MVYDTQWKCDISKNVLKIILLMKEHNKKSKVCGYQFPVMVLPPSPPPPLPGDYCVGLGVQASKETARKLEFNKLLSLSLLHLYWGLLCLTRDH